MSTTAEGEAPAVEQPPAEAPAPATEDEKPKEVEQEEEAKKPVKEKKPRAPREKKPRPPKTASHPPYFQMIKEAILALDEKSGSSPYAIAKYMEDKHKAVLPSNFRKILALQLKNSASKGKLIKVKASYKLSETGKKESAKPSSKPPKKTEAAAKKPKEMAPVPRAKRTRKSEATKPVKKAAKKPVKKAAAAKPKQPKSIKSPAAKRAKKVAAA
ncbi:histone H1 [Rhodamnia argentea]|uniref:Histone H1 n=1 Tax=Rhodamnia argentea TaxID=178133 RepID=A0A8B8NNB7_9MYRT|nr:histone H1 [Rhodamnia argentea]